ncbi:MAG: carboxypeptidase-like regulatory domain-containing protein [Bacteroidetes bacterium]|nr:carboxypeptidase-like regulatory domain-containing protein [Bacteroidota bacterium]MBL7104055.1 carboxypeptidase-like regulatory domain-containing protein [Bacteroidales bacterium]
MGSKKLLFIFLLCFCLHGLLHAQVDENELIQFSGIVVTADSIKPVPFTNIVIKNTWRGTVADYYGYFSFVARINDTVVFSSVGFKKGKFVIPDTISSNRYSLIQVMTSDTILLPQTVIYPWPSREQFKEAFLALDVPDDDYERARKNLNAAKLKEMAASYPMDGSMNYQYSMQLYQDKLYYIGQTQPITILNPFAWAQFIKAWEEGKFKRKRKD